MEEFDTYDSASQYGQGLDDTASMISGYTVRTQKTAETVSQLESEINHLRLDEQSISDSKTVDDDFDGVLDDVKDDTVANLPLHACRYKSLNRCERVSADSLIDKLLWHSLSSIGS